jgi:lipopolysaccharide exporter
MQIDNIKSITVRNLGISAISVLGIQLTQFVTNIILARVLLAADYGIVGYSQILINFMMQFSDFGLTSALIQRKEIDDKALCSGLWLKLVLSIATTAVLIGSSRLFSYLLNDQNFGLVLMALSVNLMLTVFSFLPQVVIARDLQYQKLVIPQTAGVCLGAVVSIFMAIRGYGFWSLVVGNLINTGSTAIMLNIVKPVRFQWFLDKQVLRELAGFGWHMLLPGLIIFTIMNADNFLVGSFQGASALGYYTIAFTWGSMICTLLAAVVHRVLFPTFSRMQHDLVEIKSWYLESLKYIALIAVPVNLGLFLLAREFLFFVLGNGTDRWLSALPALKVLCLYGIARALLEPVGNVISGIGKPQFFIKANSIAATLEIIGVVLAVSLSSSLAWVATAVLIGFAAQYLIYYPIMKKEISLSKKEITRALASTLVAALFMTAAIVMTKPSLPFSQLGLLLAIVIGALVYTLAFGLCDRWQVFGEMSRLAFRRRL